MAMLTIYTYQFSGIQRFMEEFAINSYFPKKKMETLFFLIIDPTKGYPRKYPRFKFRETEIQSSVRVQSSFQSWEDEKMELIIIQLKKEALQRDIFGKMNSYLIFFPKSPKATIKEMIEFFDVKKGENLFKQITTNRSDLLLQSEKSGSKQDDESDYQNSQNSEDQNDSDYLQNKTRQAKIKQQSEYYSQNEQESNSQNNSGEFEISDNRPKVQQRQQNKINSGLKDNKKKSIHQVNSIKKKIRLESPINKKIVNKTTTIIQIIDDGEQTQTEEQKELEKPIKSKNLKIQTRNDIHEVSHSNEVESNSESNEQQSSQDELDHDLIKQIEANQLRYNNPDVYGINSSQEVTKDIKFHKLLKKQLMNNEQFQDKEAYKTLVKCENHLVRYWQVDKELQRLRQLNRQDVCYLNQLIEQKAKQK